MVDVCGMWKHEAEFMIYHGKHGLGRIWSINWHSNGANIGFAWAWSRANIAGNFCVHIPVSLVTLPEWAAQIYNHVLRCF